MVTGNPVSFEINLSIFLNKAPPPVRTRPISTKSADNSGGVCSSAFLIPDTISFRIGFSASDESSSEIFTIDPIKFKISQNLKKSLKIINFLTKSGFMSSPYSRYPLTRREIYRRHFEWYKT